MSFRKIVILAVLIFAVLSLSSCAKKRIPYIGENGNWWIGKSDLGVAAQGPAGETGPAGAAGESGATGEKGDTGSTGKQGPVGAKGDTGPQGPSGEKGDTGDTGATGAPGLTPYIGTNGNWWIGEQDTGVFVGAYSESCSDGLSFVFETRGGKAGAIVTGYRGSDTDVVIPSCFSSVPVIGVEASAFAGNRSITSVRLSANTVYIAEGAFEGCENLTDLDFNGAPIETIPKRAFKNTSLQSAMLPEGVKCIEAEAFSSVMNIFVCIPSSVTKAEDSFSASAFLAFGAEDAPRGLEEIVSGNRNIRHALGVDTASVVHDKDADAYLCRVADGYAVLCCNADAEGVFTLPSFYDATPISCIMREAVVCSASVTDVVIGKFVTRLESSCIVASHTLRSVYFPAALSSYGPQSLSASAKYLLFGAESAPSGFTAEEIICDVAAGTLRENESYFYVLHSDSVTLLRYIADPYIAVLSVPDTLEGKSVTVIKTGFFAGYHTNRIEIPLSVKRIEKQAFAFLKDTEAIEPFSAAEIHFAAKDYEKLFIDRAFFSLHPEDKTPKTVYFDGIPADAFVWG